MILGKSFNWYLKIIQTTIIIAAIWIIFTGMVSKVPLIGWVFNLLVLPVTWVLKYGGAGFIGYQTVKKYQGTQVQGLVSGGIFGIGIGLASMVTILLNLIIRPNEKTLFLGTFGILAVIISETVIGLIIGFIGALLAGNPKKEQ